ncbi:hypothetical protein PM001_20200, partial [[Clostridium] symbiosum]|uniref:hypothetical protein n=1 Tax=Clostridium symbiosum TaxID=1512 RepID=UPI001A9AAF09
VCFLYPPLAESLVYITLFQQGLSYNIKNRSAEERNSKEEVCEYADQNIILGFFHAEPVTQRSLHGVA